MALVSRRRHTSCDLVTRVPQGQRLPLLCALFPPSVQARLPFRAPCDLRANCGLSADPS